MLQRRNRSHRCMPGSSPPPSGRLIWPEPSPKGCCLPRVPSGEHRLGLLERSPRGGSVCAQLPAGCQGGSAEPPLPAEPAMEGRGHISVIRHRPTGRQAGRRDGAPGDRQLALGRSCDDASRGHCVGLFKAIVSCICLSFT